MRQAGIIAAPGFIALTKMVDRMKDDHTMARLLSEGIKSISGLELLHEVQTNIVRMDVSGLGLNAEQFVAEAYQFGILAESKGYNIIRLVTHRDIGRAEVERTIECITKIAEK